MSGPLFGQVIVLNSNRIRGETEPSRGVIRPRPDVDSVDVLILGRLLAMLVTR